MMEIKKSTFRCTGLLIISIMAMFSVSSGQTKLDSARFRILYDGFGPVKIGMSVPKASKVLGTRLIVEGGGSGTCHYVSARNRFKDVGFMITNNRIARIDVTGKNFITELGARIGDSEGRIKRLYGKKVKVEKHFYTDGRYLTVNRGKFSIVFETDETKRVVSILAGKAPEIGYVEGCS